MSFTGKTSDYASYIISAQQKQKEIDEWRSRFISPLENEQNVLTQNFLQKTSSLEQQSRYDISSAYSAYKRSQQQINTSNAWTGVKNFTNSYLADQYALKFNNIANTKFSSFSDLKNKYVKSYNDLDNKIYSEATKQGEKYSNFERTAYDFYTGMYDTEFNPANEETMRNFYSIDENGQFILNEKGKGFWDKILNSKDAFEEDGTQSSYNFETYLYNEDRDMYDFYIENKGNIREWVGGLDRDDFTYTKEEDFSAKASAILENINPNKVVGGLPTEYSSEEDRFNTLTKIENQLKIVNKVVVDKQVVGNNKVSFGGETYTLVSPIEKNSNQITEYPSQEYEQFTEYSSPGYNANDTLTLDPAVFEKGNVFSTDGTTYFYVVNDKGFALRLVKEE